MYLTNDINDFNIYEVFLLDLYFVSSLSSRHIDCCVESKTPDDQIFHLLASTYASNHATMHQGNLCVGDNFRGGITNGAFWYDVKGKFLGSASRILINYWLCCCGKEMLFYFLLILE